MEDGPTPKKDPPLRSVQLQSALVANAVLQGVMLMFTAPILDGGFISRMWGQAMVGYWLMTGWLVLRLGSTLTVADALLIRAGFFLWLVVTVIVEREVRTLCFGGI